jgi:hypothetical protein
MGKSSASQRHRRMGNSSSASSTNAPSKGGDALHKYKTTKDPCHNGQVPACQLLLDAVKDVFPELEPAQNRPTNQQSGRKESPPPPPPEVPSSSPPEQSALAQLLRWRILWLRESALQNHHHKGAVSGEQPPGDAAGAVAAKKKRRKKKKKGEEEPTAAKAATTTVKDASAKAENGHDQTKNRETSIAAAASGNDNAFPQEEPPQDPDSNEDDSSRVVHVIPPDSPSENSAVDSPPKSLAEAHVYDPLKLSYITMPGYGARDDKGGDLESEVESSTRCTHQLFNEWLDQAFLTAPSSKVGPASPEKQRQDWDSFLEFCQKRLSDKEKPEPISLGDVLEIVRNIQCRDCREEALDVIRKWVELASNATNESPYQIVMRSSYLNPRNLPRVDHDEEAAFDYVALEEGHHVPLNQSDSDVEDDSDEAANVSFVISQHSKTQRSSEGSSSSRHGGDLEFRASQLQLVPKTLTSENFDTFVRDWLPVGVLESSLVDVSMKPKGTIKNGNESDPVQISPEILDGLKRNITKQVDEFFSDESSEGDSFEDLLMTEVEKVQHALAPQQNIHLTAHQVLSNCNAFCEQYIASDLLRRMMHGDDGLLHEAQADLEIRTWSRFLEMITDIFEETEKYYKYTEDNFVDENGAIGTPIFVNAKMRMAYGGWVEKKVQSATAFGTELKSDLMNRRVLKERSTRAVWAADHFGKNDQMFDLKFELEQVLENLLDWVNVIHERRMSIIRREQRQKREKILDQLEEVSPHLEKAYEEVEQNFSRDQQLYFRSILSLIKLPRGAPLHSQIDENAKVFMLVKGVILMWRHVRFMKMHTVQAKVPPLPLPLKQFMMESHDPSDIGALHRGRSLCWHGWGGKRRVRCIIAGILFSWLGSVCSEWKSESAAAELLIDFDAEVAAPNYGGTNKPSKKAKKKKKKTAVAGSTVESDSKPSSEVIAASNKTKAAVGAPPQAGMKLSSEVIAGGNKTEAVAAAPPPQANKKAPAEVSNKTKATVGAPSQASTNLSSEVNNKTEAVAAAPPYANKKPPAEVSNKAKATVGAPPQAGTKLSSEVNNKTTATAGAPPQASKKPHAEVSNKAKATVGAPIQPAMKLSNDIIAASNKTKVAARAPPQAGKKPSAQVSNKTKAAANAEVIAVNNETKAKDGTPPQSVTKSSVEDDGNITGKQKSATNGSNHSTKEIAGGKRAIAHASNGKAPSKPSKSLQNIGHDSQNVKVSKDAETVGKKKKKKVKGTTASNDTKSKNDGKSKASENPKERLSAPKTKKSSDTQAPVDGIEAERGTSANMKEPHAGSVAAEKKEALAELDSYKSFVVVEDKGNMISAEHFLIARFNDLMDAAAKGDATIVSVA